MKRAQIIKRSEQEWNDNLSDPFFPKAHKSLQILEIVNLRDFQGMYSFIFSTLYKFLFYIYCLILILDAYILTFIAPIARDINAFLSSRTKTHNIFILLLHRFAHE